jgi:hypothetical protein
MSRKDKQSLKRLAITVRYVTSPDAEMRLSRAIDILLESATRKQNPQQIEKSRHLTTPNRTEIPEPTQI